MSTWLRGGLHMQRCLLLAGLWPNDGRERRNAQSRQCFSRQAETGIVGRAGPEVCSCRQIAKKGNRRRGFRCKDVRRFGRGGGARTICMFLQRPCQDVFFFVVAARAGHAAERRKVDSVQCLPTESLLIRVEIRAEVSRFCRAYTNRCNLRMLMAQNRLRKEFLVLWLSASFILNFHNL